jgi:hypothetical protein
LCDLLATMVETTLRTGTANLARTLFSRPLAIWTLTRGVLRGKDDGEAPLSPFTYAAPWVAAIPAGERRGVERGQSDAYKRSAAPGLLVFVAQGEVFGTEDVVSHPPIVVSAEDAAEENPDGSAHQGPGCHEPDLARSASRGSPPSGTSPTWPPHPDLAAASRLRAWCTGIQKSARSVVLRQCPPQKVRSAEGIEVDVDVPAAGHEPAAGSASPSRGGPPRQVCIRVRVIEVDVDVPAAGHEPAAASATWPPQPRPRAGPVHEPAAASTSATWPGPHLARSASRLPPRPRPHRGCRAVCLPGFLNGRM